MLSPLECNSTIVYNWFMKRPDLALRNKTNNPQWNKESREKMRASLTGKKQSEATKAKRSASLKAFYAGDPKRKLDRVKVLHETYTSKIPKGWEKMRLAALERDNYTCQDCGINDQRVLVHHRNYKGTNMSSWRDMDNRLENLQTLCYRCHNQFHRHKSKDYHERMAQL